LSESTSEKLIDDARETSRKAEEVASHHAGLDLAERLKAAEEVIETQKRHLMEAAAMIDKLVEVLGGKRRTG
jgi:vacuolar-type H+-ATPase subunit H